MEGRRPAGRRPFYFLRNRRKEGHIFFDHLFHFFFPTGHVVSADTQVGEREGLYHRNVRIATRTEFEIALVRVTDMHEAREFGVAFRRFGPVMIQDGLCETPWDPPAFTSS